MAAQPFFTLEWKESTFESKWTMYGKGQTFAASDLEQIASAIVLNCNGKEGPFKGLKVTSVSGQEAWLPSLDRVAAAKCVHLQMIDPSDIRFYQLINSETGKIITRTAIV